MDAFDLFIAPSRRTRRLVRRPYFSEARRLYELLAPNYGADPAALERFLAVEAGHAAPHGHGHHAGGAGPEGEGPQRWRGRRRRSRGGRRHRANRGHVRHPAAAAGTADAAGANGAPQDASPHDRAAGVPHGDSPIPAGIAPRTH